MFSVGAEPTGVIGSIIWHSEGFFISMLSFAIIIEALLSWFAPRGIPKFSALLYDLTSPILNPIRRTIPPFGGLDLSPLIAILLLQLLVLPVMQAITSALAGV